MYPHISANTGMLLHVPFKGNGRNVFLPVHATDEGLRRT